MQKRLTQKDGFFNNIKRAVDDDVYVGIDVDKINCRIAIWLNEVICTPKTDPFKMRKNIL